MVSESIGYKGFKIDITLNESIYRVAFGESGIGKSYGFSVVLKALESVGYLTLMINCNNYDVRKVLLSKAKYDIIIIDEVEQFDDFDINEFIGEADTIIYISRVFIGRDDPMCKIDVGKRSVNVIEV